MYTQERYSSHHESVCFHIMWRIRKQKTACRYNWLRLAFLEYSYQCLTSFHQVIHDFLCQFSCLRISTEFGASKVSRWKMAKACCPHFARSLLHSLLKRHVSSLNVLVCAIVLCSHAACKNFAGLFAVRFVLGICEGSITAGFMIVSSMFYTRREHTARVGYWCE